MPSTRKRTTLILAAAVALPLLAGGSLTLADPPGWAFGQQKHRDHGDDGHWNGGYRRIADAGDDNHRGDDRRSDDRRSDDRRSDDRRSDDRRGDDRRGDDRHRDDRTPRFGDQRDGRGNLVGRVLREMPHGYRRMRIHDRDYYVHEGHYYRHEPRGYVMVQLPIGSFVVSLPDSFLRVHIGGISYFVAGGLYYRADNGGYTVVAPPAPSPDTIGNASGNVVVNVPLLNVRNGPSYDFNVISVVNRGDNLPVYGQAPGWHYVQLPSGSYGWVNDDYIVVAPDQPQG